VFAKFIDASAGISAHDDIVSGLAKTYTSVEAHQNLGYETQIIVDGNYVGIDFIRA
jgi:hypothetical protein